MSDSPRRFPPRHLPCNSQRRCSWMLTSEGKLERPSVSFHLLSQNVGNERSWGEPFRFRPRCTRPEISRLKPGTRQQPVVETPLQPFIYHGACRDICHRSDWAKAGKASQSLCAYPLSCREVCPPVTSTSISRRCKSSVQRPYKLGRPSSSLAQSTLAPSARERVRHRSHAQLKSSPA